MPVEQVKEETTASQFIMWQEFLEREINEFHREDWYFAQLAYHLYCIPFKISWIFGGKTQPSKEPKDFLIQFKFGESEPVKHLVLSNQEDDSPERVITEPWSGKLSDKEIPPFTEEEEARLDAAGELSRIMWLASMGMRPDGSVARKVKGKKPHEGVKRSRQSSKIKAVVTSREIAARKDQRIPATPRIVKPGGL